MVSLLDPFIDDASRPGINHLRTEDRLLIIECTLATNVAASLREKDGEAVSMSHSLKPTVSGSLICSRTAPFVGVETVEINRLIRLTTCKVVLKHRTKLGNISSGVSDRNWSISLSRQVGLHISNRGLDVWSRRRSLKSINNFISNPETTQVVILLELVHDLGKCRELFFGPHRGGLDDGGIEGIEIEPDVDSCIAESGHAAIVIGSWVDVVDADGVGTDGLHGLGVELTLVGVDERIVRGTLVCNT